MSKYRRRMGPVFTARRACIAQTMPSQDVCLSVRPSVCLYVTRRYSVAAAEHILKKIFTVRAAVLYLAALKNWSPLGVAAADAGALKMQDMELADQIAGHEIT